MDCRSEELYSSENFNVCPTWYRDPTIGRLPCGVTLVFNSTYVSVIPYIITPDGAGIERYRKIKYLFKHCESSGLAGQSPALRESVSNRQPQCEIRGPKVHFMHQGWPCFRAQGRQASTETLKG